MAATTCNSFPSSLFSLPRRWFTLTAKPTGSAAASLAHYGSESAQAGIQRAAEEGLQLAKNSDQDQPGLAACANEPALSSSRLLWALAARLSYLESRLAVKGERKWPKIMLDELTWSVACERPTDGWPEPERHKANCEVSAVDAHKRISGGLAAIIHKNYSSNGSLAAEDIGQAAWLAMCRCYWAPSATQRFLGLSKLQTTVGTIAKRIISKERRKLARLGGGNSAESAAGLQDTPGPSEKEPHPDVLDFLARLRPLLNHLPAGQKNVIELFYICEHSVKHIAQITGTTPPNVTQQRGRALERLRLWLGERPLSDWTLPLTEAGRAAVAEQVESLSLDQQEAFRMYYFESKTIAQIADATGSSPPDVENRLNDATARIRKSPPGA